MVGIRKPRQRFAKADGRRARRRQIKALLTATWDQDLKVMQYLADR